MSYDPIRTGIEILGVFVEAQEHWWAVDGTPTQRWEMNERAANRRDYEKRDRACLTAMQRIRRHARHDTLT